ncbi:hypothetical protein KUTeg_015286 [Tegillarca granosa]|uniref:Uncharacterized protein n=1 Tax=Tegillarca granosa TaxID=220873 RepID=A0ABQ9ETB0_TEGGR|nr:hypothetical protein KUTeg_015286 [Tegillarca granosa]
MSTSRKIPVLAIIAIIVIIISGILQLIALATPYWHTIYSRGDVRAGHGGLWHGCFRLTNIVYCSSPTHVPGWLMAVRILEVIGMMFMSGALMMMVIFLVVSSVKWSKITRNSAAASALISDFFKPIDVYFPCGTKSLQSRF